eukprot:scaffold142_cov315-Prasinococcus_capsulatus_cf.AAC.4
MAAVDIDARAFHILPACYPCFIITIQVAVQVWVPRIQVRVSIFISEDPEQANHQTFIPSPNTTEGSAHDVPRNGMIALPTVPRH